MNMNRRGFLQGLFLLPLLVFLRPRPRALPPVVAPVPAMPPELQLNIKQIVNYEGWARKHFRVRPLMKEEEPL